MSWDSCVSVQSEYLYGFGKPQKTQNLAAYDLDQISSKTKKLHPQLFCFGKTGVYNTTAFQLWKSTSPLYLLPTACLKRFTREKMLG